MQLKAAVVYEIGQLRRPVVTGYQIGLILFELYRLKLCKGERIAKIRKSVPTRGDYTGVVRRLVADNILIELSGALKNRELYGVIGHELPAANELICIVDPFCFISHASAMEYHGLTDRLPSVLYATGPLNARTRALAEERMAHDLGLFLRQYGEAGLPILKRPTITAVARKALHLQKSVHYHPGAYLTVQNRALRVSTIGRTFLDMLQQPNLCGGIYHVLSIFELHANRYLRLIIDEIDQHGSAIDKVRCGYILEEIAKIQVPEVEKWVSYAQRGGSRRLDPQSDYAPQFSEKWCLSLNVEM